MMYSREFLVEGQFQPKTIAKLVCVGPEQRVIGLHMIGLAVDEILQVDPASRTLAPTHHPNPSPQPHP